MDLFVFGYGSLLFRPDFPFLDQRVARLDGWARRFAQGSPDHRGTPEAPGRVVTLVRDPATTTEGILFRVAASARDEVLEALDRREQGGYSRLTVRVRARGDDELHVEATTWIALPENPHWLGPADVASMAAHVTGSRGPSGENREYVLRLAATLAALDIHDAHVDELARALGGAPATSA